MPSVGCRRGTEGYGVGDMHVCGWGYHVPVQDPQLKGGDAARIQDARLKKGYHFLSCQEAQCEVIVAL